MQQNTSLEEACRNHQIQKVRSLLGQRAEPNSKSLEIACANGDYFIASALLQHGADPSVRNSECMRLACLYGHTPIVRLLLDYGVDVHVMQDGPLRISSERGYLEIVRLLLNRGANVHAKNGEAISLALQKGYLDIADLLLYRDSRTDNCATLTPDQARRALVHLLMCSSAHERKKILAEERSGQDAASLLKKFL